MNSSPQVAKGWGAISRATTVRALITAAIICSGIATVQALEKVLNATFDKPPAPSAQFALMGRQLRDSTGEIRFESKGADGVLDEETVAALQTSEYLVRRYYDVHLDPNSMGGSLNLNVNYYPTGSSTPHVPEICWVGSGRVPAGDGAGFFDVKDVPRKDGSKIDLRMRMISFLSMPGDARAANDQSGYINVAYVFHVNGEYVANRNEVTSRFWKASNQYAYHAKIEITPTDAQGIPMACTREQAEKAISEFIRAALPQIEECLPDPKILTATVTPPGAPASAH